MSKRLFVVDSNVLMHDPSSLFRFQEHDIFVPMMVLEELDNNKKGRTEVARNARQASRFLDELLSGASHAQIEQGLPLNAQLDASLAHHKTPNGQKELAEQLSGKLFFQTRAYPDSLPHHLPGNLPDNNILGTALALQENQQERQVTLVTKDINLRIKAAVVGIHAEDYRNDRVLEDVDLLYTGHYLLEKEFWDRHAREMESWVDAGRTFYRLKGPDIEHWSPNEFLFSDQEHAPFDAIVRRIEDDGAIIETARDYRNASHAVWGITARNREQNYALNLLMDPEIDFVTLLGLSLIHISEPTRPY